MVRNQPFTENSLLKKVVDVYNGLEYRYYDYDTSYSDLHRLLKMERVRYSKNFFAAKERGNWVTVVIVINN